MIRLQCKTCIWYQTLDAEDSAFFDSKVAAGAPIRKLWRACRGYGLVVSEERFRAHVRWHHPRPTPAQPGTPATGKLSA
jgi:hypothetical protein